jgi:hypothetical protein
MQPGWSSKGRRFRRTLGVARITDCELRLEGSRLIVAEHRGPAPPEVWELSGASVLPAEWRAPGGKRGGVLVVDGLAIGAEGHDVALGRVDSPPILDIDIEVDARALEALARELRQLDPVAPTGSAYRTRPRTLSKSRRVLRATRPWAGWVAPPVAVLLAIPAGILTTLGGLVRYPWPPLAILFGVLAAVAVLAGVYRAIVQIATYAIHLAADELAVRQGSRHYASANLVQGDSVRFAWGPTGAPRAGLRITLLGGRELRFGCRSEQATDALPRDDTPELLLSRPDWDQLLRWIETAEARRRRIRVEVEVDEQTGTRIPSSIRTSSPARCASGANATRATPPGGVVDGTSSRSCRWP